MARVHDEQLLAYIRQKQLPGFSDAIQVDGVFAGDDEQAWHIASGAARAVVKWYAPGAGSRARREAAGLRLGGGLGMAPGLLFEDLDGAALGGPTLAFEDVRGERLGDAALSDADTRGWLFLLLMLHHLSPDAVAGSSSMSPDIAAWWQRNLPVWEACKTLYHDAAYRPLMDALSNLHAIAGVRVGTNAGLWQDITRRPCHGNPVPAHVLRVDGRLLLVEWDGFGLGDPAMEVGRACALAVLSGELSSAQYVRFVSDYLDGTRDLGDRTLEERLRIFASVLPLGFCFTVLHLLGQESAMALEDRARYVKQVARALIWIQDAMGVEVGDPRTLLAPLGVTAGSVSSAP